MPPFVIISAARSGSWLLVELLNQHRLIACNGEPLNPHDPNWPAERERLSGECLLSLCLDATIVKPAGAPIAGFKLLREHVQNERGAGLLDATLRRRGIRVILLRRGNLLESLRSLAQVEQTGRWQDPVGDAGAAHPVRLPPDRCASYFAKVDGFFADLRSRCAHLERVELTYEDLTGAPRPLDPVWKLLDVAPVSAQRTVLNRQEARPLRETVANFDELREHFVDTPYGQFFD